MNKSSHLNGPPLLSDSFVHHHHPDFQVARGQNDFNRSHACGFMILPDLNDQGRLIAWWDKTIETIANLAHKILRPYIIY